MKLLKCRCSYCTSLRKIDCTHLVHHVSQDIIEPPPMSSKYYNATAWSTDPTGLACCSPNLYGKVRSMGRYRWRATFVACFYHNVIHLAGLVNSILLTCTSVKQPFQLHPRETILRDSHEPKTHVLLWIFTLPEHTTNYRANRMINSLQAILFFLPLTNGG